MNEINLNKNISELRKAAGLTQEALAAKLGLSYQAVSKWENGLSCPDILMLPKLAEIFNVSLDTLFGLESTVASANENAGMPWPDNDDIHVVVYQGHEILSEEAVRHKFYKQELSFRWEGPALNVSSSLSLHVEGYVEGDASAGESINCGNVGGNVSAGAGVACDNIQGCVSAGGSITCDNICGSAEAGGNITCDDIWGDVEAAGSVICDTIKGRANTGCKACSYKFEDSDWRGVKGSFHIEKDDMSPELRKKCENINKSAESIADTALSFADKTVQAVEKTLKGIFK